MNRIHLIVTKTKESLPIGSSKLLGRPHVRDDFVWPTATNPIGDEYHLDFLCQINCAEAAPFDKESLLPKTGILYFFHSFEHAPYHGNAAVLYDDGDPKHFIELIPTDEDGNDLSLPEQKITFENVEYSGYVPDGADSHFLLGSPCSPEQLGLGSGGLSKADQLLLEIDALDGGEYEIDFGDTGTLCFFIKKKDLARKDFSKAWYQICTN